MCIPVPQSIDLGIHRDTYVTAFHGIPEAVRGYTGIHRDTWLDDGQGTEMKQISLGIAFDER